MNTRMLWAPLALFPTLLACSLSDPPDYDEDDEGALESPDRDPDSDEPSVPDTWTSEPVVALPEAPAGEWTYHELPGMQCRSGSPAGIGVRYSEETSDRLAIYLEGGGWCFDGLTCLLNPDTIPPDKFTPGPSEGIFDDQNAENPLMGFNLVHIPYCTGDFHSGNRPDTDVPGGPPSQMFVGRDNLEIALAHIAATFPAATEVVVVGESAGGMGGVLNYELFASHFPEQDVALIDDSFPILRDDFLAPCLQQKWRELWGLDDTLPADCEGCFGPDGGGLSNVLAHLGDKYPLAPKGVISADADIVVALYFGLGLDQCSGIELPDGRYPDFEKALYDMRETAMESPSWGSYFFPSTLHPWVSTSNFYGVQTRNITLSDWMADVIAGAPTNVSPLDLTP